MPRECVRYTKTGSSYILVSQPHTQGSTDAGSDAFAVSRGYFLADENSAEYKVQFPPADISGVLSPDDKRHGWVISVFHQLHCLVSI